MAAFAAVLGATTALAAGPFRIWSPALTPGATLPLSSVYNGASCRGGDTLPALAWDGLPAGAKSLALTLFDPDARAGQGWWHWVAVDVPVASRSSAVLGDSPALLNDFGKRGYSGPCPPRGSGPHRYVFTVYALDVANLAIDTDTKPAAAAAAIEAHAIASARVTFRYER